MNNFNGNYQGGRQGGGNNDWEFQGNNNNNGGNNQNYGGQGGGNYRGNNFNQGGGGQRYNGNQGGGGGRNQNQQQNQNRGGQRRVHNNGFIGGKGNQNQQGFDGNNRGNQNHNYANTADRNNQNQSGSAERGPILETKKDFIPFVSKGTMNMGDDIPIVTNDPIKEIKRLKELQSLTLLIETYLCDITTLTLEDFNSILKDVYTKDIDEIIAVVVDAVKRSAGDRVTSPSEQRALTKFVDLSKKLVLTPLSRQIIEPTKAAKDKPKKKSAPKPRFSDSGRVLQDLVGAKQLFQANLFVTTVEYESLTETTLNEASMDEGEFDLFLSINQSSAEGAIGEMRVAKFFLFHNVTPQAAAELCKFAGLSDMESGDVYYTMWSNFGTYESLKGENYAKFYTALKGDDANNENHSVQVQRGRKICDVLTKFTVSTFLGEDRVLDMLRQLGNIA